MRLEPGLPQRYDGDRPSREQSALRGTGIVNGGRLEVKVASVPADRAACMELRRRVFIEEQGVSQSDEWDGLDDASVHLLAIEDGLPVGTARLRILADGQAKAERVAVLADRRGAGIGRLMMHLAMDLARERNAVTMVLGAQLTAIPFYQRLGFEATGAVFDDAGIPHRRMHRDLWENGLIGGG
jgi:ElaA protein